MVRQVLTVYRPDGSFRLVYREVEDKPFILNLGPNGLIELPPAIREILGINQGGKVCFSLKDEKSLWVGAASESYGDNGNENEKNRKSKKHPRA
ncbi:MAG TPA: hypothetical protein GXX40_05025 [Firmicutes bacterium]|nr:hypothetical protein [Bacillota bacterium]